MQYGNRELDKYSSRLELLQDVIFHVIMINNVIKLTMQEDFSNNSRTFLQIVQSGIFYAICRS